MIFKNKNFKVLFILLSLLFAACSSDSEGPSDPDDNTGGKDMVATMAFESGDKIDFGYTFPNINLAKPTITYEKGSDQSVLGISGTMGSFGIGIIGVINEEGEYSYNEDFDKNGDEGGVLITLQRDIEDDFQQFLPYNPIDKTIGSAKLTITTLTKNEIKATFSATLYNINTGEKVTIKDGKISSGLYRHEVEAE